MESKTITTKKRVSSKTKINNTKGIRKSYHVYIKSIIGKRISRHFRTFIRQE